MGTDRFQRQPACMAPARDPTQSSAPPTPGHGVSGGRPAPGWRRFAAHPKRLPASERSLKGIGPGVYGECQFGDGRVFELHRMVGAGVPERATISCSRSREFSSVNSRQRVCRLTGSWKDARRHALGPGSRERHARPCRARAVQVRTVCTRATGPATTSAVRAVRERAARLCWQRRRNAAHAARALVAPSIRRVSCKHDAIAKDLHDREQNEYRAGNDERTEYHPCVDVGPVGTRSPASSCRRASSWTSRDAFQNPPVGRQHRQGRVGHDGLTGDRTTIVEMADRRKRIVARAYDRIARRYLEWGGTIKGDPRHALLARLARDLEAGARVLELRYAGLVFRLRRS